MPTRLSLCKAEQSQLLVIDLQLRLLEVMPDAEQDNVINNCRSLMTAASKLNIPTLLSEQYPEGLGKTVEVIHSDPDIPVCEKTSFSCCRTSRFEQQLASPEQRPQIILCGIETHICVLQTAADLQYWGYEVFIAEDAVASRNNTNKINAIQRMRDAGMNITNTESTLFEWLRDAKHPDFKTIAQLIK